MYPALTQQEEKACRSKLKCWQAMLSCRQQLLPGSVQIRPAPSCHANKSS